MTHKNTRFHGQYFTIPNLLSYLRLALIPLIVWLYCSKEAYLPAAGLIGVITCLLSAIGVKVGAMFGDKYRAPAERIGGIVLILIGVKTLLTGLGIL